MKNTARLLYGIALTAAIYFATLLLSRLIRNIDGLVINSYLTQALILSCLSVAAILSMKKHLSYRIALPKFKLILRPIIFTIITYVGFSLFLSLLANLIGVSRGEVHPAIKLNQEQFLLFVVIAASIAEELLFRGFLLNLLAPLKQRGIKILNRKISLSVMISALLFGLAHLSLASFGYSPYFLIRTVVFTCCIGLIAGYYQGKYNNNAYAITVHMTSNLVGILPVIMLAMQKA